MQKIYQRLEGRPQLQQQSTLEGVEVRQPLEDVRKVKLAKVQAKPEPVDNEFIDKLTEMAMSSEKKKPGVGKKKKTTVHKAMPSNQASKAVTPLTSNLTDVSEQRIVEVQSSTSSEHRKM